MPELLVATATELLGAALAALLIAAFRRLSAALSTAPPRPDAV